MSTPSLRSRLKPLTPHRERPGDLDDRTVGRDGILAALDRRFRAAATSENRPHTLIVGPRGAGKSHVVSVALHRLRADAELRDHLVVARVDEDVVGLRTYVDLMIEVLRAMGAPSEAVASAKADRTINGVERLLQDQLGERTLVLVAENLSRLFEQIGSAGQQNLRSFVESSARVVVLATTPLLTAAIAERSEPWFGSFTVERLADLSLEEGTALLSQIAAADGDEEFVEFLESERGQARLEALHHLVGGSPRLWIVFAGCASMEALDDLVPAVEQLLEQLAGYYQQLLWDLSPVEAALVAELGQGAVSAPAKDIAAAAGVDPETASTSLRRLADERWVRGEKVPGTDQRTTWYRLREPLLRHHFQYRRDDHQPLTLIVEILRAWFDPDDRLARLAEVGPASESERHLLAAMRFDPPRPLDAAWASGDPDDLLVEARRWISERDTVGDPTTGAILEAAVIAAQDGPASATRALEARGLSAELRRAVAEAMPGPGTEPQEALSGAIARLAAAPPAGSNVRLLRFVNYEWNPVDDPQQGLRNLRELVDPDEHGWLALALGDALALEAVRATEYDEAVTTFESLAANRSQLLGDEHRDTLNTRGDLAYWTRHTDGDEAAVGRYDALLVDMTRVLGPCDPDTLATRHFRANLAGWTGNSLQAIDLFVGLIADLTQTLGPSHRSTLRARDSHAYWTSDAGNGAAAVDLYTALATDRTVALGRQDPETLSTRHDRAMTIGWNGDPSQAALDLAGVVADSQEALGAEDLAVLRARDDLAYWTSMSGDYERSTAQYAELIDDMTRARGRDHPDVLDIRNYHAMGVANTGELDRASQLLNDLVHEYGEEQGRTRPLVLRTRLLLGALMLSARRLRDAVDQLAPVADAGHLLDGKDVATLTATALASRVAAGEELPPRAAFGRVLGEQVYPLLRLLADARGGSAEAAAQLPEELRSLVSRSEPPIP